jgi:dipeptidyl aminopeptidase/acylaminoacyl peptidase
VTEVPAWERRFTAPRIWDVRASWTDPTRLAAITNEYGVWQAWAWDLASSGRRRASAVGVGVEHLEFVPDGSGIVWWEDPTGDETGRWVVAPFEGGGPRPLVPEVPLGWSNGISITPGGVAIGVVTRAEGYRLFVSAGGAPAVELYRHPMAAGQGDALRCRRIALSADGTMVAIRTAERGDIEITGLRVIDVATGSTLGDLDEPGIRFIPAAWSPIHGDRRLLFMHDRGGWLRPAVWDLEEGSSGDLAAGIEGELTALAWFPGGAGALLLQTHEGRDRLLRVPLDGAAAEILLDPGTVDDAMVLGDGVVWARVHSSVEPPRWVDGSGATVLEIPDAEIPAGRPVRPFWVHGPGGRVQAFVVEPDGAQPHPTIVSIHGGPNWHHTDGFDERTHAYVDHGYAVLWVNYRGSTGYGSAFRDAIRGRMGLTESEDVLAAVDRLVADGVADPDRLFLEGWSWGGYLSELLAGLHPERWRAVAAGIPGGDYVAGHYESSPEMRQWDVAMFGGTPIEVPEAYHRSNPMAYIDRVQAAMLVIAGEADPRSTLGSTMTYVHGLKVRGVEIEIRVYEGGHHANAMDEQIEHVRLIVDLFARHGGVPVA